MGDYLMSLIKANDIQNASGGIPTVKSQQLIPTAWVSWNGIGTVSIYNSENVSSITDDGVGLFTINFDTSLANINYVAVCSTQESNTSSHGDSNNRVIGPARVARSTSNFKVRAANPSDYSTRDNKINDVLIMGGQA